VPIKPRVVFDTSALVSAALFASSIPGCALEKAVDHCQLITSDAVFAEFTSVIGRDKFTGYVSWEKRALFAAGLYSIMQPVTVTAEITICRDPADNKFLDLAMQGGAKYIVTGDDDLLTLHPFQSIHILSPARFLEIIL